MKYLCCFNLTIATRIIASIGIAVSITMINFLIHDLESEHFDSRKIMMPLLGFDWLNFQITDVTSAEYGKFAFTVLITTALLFLFINSILIFATIMENRLCTFPWFVFQAFLLISKIYSFVATCFKVKYLSVYYFVSSGLYSVFLLWWAVVIFGAQRQWKHSERMEISNMTLVTIHPDVSVFDSPQPYMSNTKYSEV